MQDIIIHRFKTVRPNGTEITRYREVVYNPELEMIKEEH